MKTHIALISLALTCVSCYPEPATQQPEYTRLNQDQVNYLQNKGFGSTVKSFRPTTVIYAEEEEYDDVADSEPESSQDRAPTYANQNYPVVQKATLQPQLNYPIPIKSTPKAYPTQHVDYERRPVKQQQQQQQYLRAKARPNEVEEEKEEEPDRLSLLLPQTKFNCNGKNGYYADEELGCEVFHYCQDNARHSWICPEGFTFHQVHLICMPPGGDNNCEKSSSFHFVNDYLYKPLNLEEHQQRPNVTLRYSDRYYPDSYRPRYEDEEEDAPVHHQHSVRVPIQPRPKLVSPTTLRPHVSHGQVFRSPEEINISLQQRRPVQYQTNEY